MIATISDSASNYAGCRMRDNANTELGWPAVAFLFAIAVFGVVLIGHAPKWPTYVSVLVWCGFVILRAVRK
jgi:hypothetical protein